MYDTVKLNNKAVTGVFWTSLQKFGSSGLSFISNMILARLLTPDDFGLIGMVMVFVYLSNVLIEAGFGSALIQKKLVTEEDYSTAFIWNVSVAIVLYIILCICAPLIADFYKITRLKEVLRVLGTILIINSLATVQTAYLRRNLDFKKIALSFLCATIIALVIAIIMVLHGYGIWCLVGFQLSQGGFNAIFIWVFSGLRFTPYFSKRAFKPLFDYGGFLLLSSLVTTARSQGLNLFIGKLFTPVNLGYFSQAKLVESAPTNAFYSVVCQVALPVLSQIQENDEKIKSVLYRLNRLISLIMLPLMVLLIVMAKPLIDILLSAKWLPSVVCLQILCMGSIARPLTDINSYAIAARGRSRLLFYISIIFFLILCLDILAGSLLGFYGVVTGVAVSEILSLTVCLFAISKVMDYPVFCQLKAYRDALVLTIVSLVPALCFGLLLPKSYWYDIVTGIIFIIIYFSLGYTTNIISFKELSRFISK